MYLSQQGIHQVHLVRVHIRHQAAHKNLHSISLMPLKNCAQLVIINPY